MAFLHNWVEWLPQLLGGLKISLLVTFASLAIGIPLGLLLAISVQAKNPVVKWLALAFVEIGRGAPALILLQFAYYGLPSAGITLSSLWSAILGLACCAGAYTSEILRGGMEAVARGQKEAADALGMGRLDKLRFIVLPQGLVVALPALLGFSITTLQATSLAFAIALPELLSQAYSIGANTFRYLSALILAGLLYAIICIPATALVGRIERKLTAHHR